MYRTHMRRHPLRLEEDAGLPGTELLSMGFGNLSGGSLEEQQQVLLTLQSAILPAPLLSLSPVARGWHSHNLINRCVTVSVWCGAGPGVSAVTLRPDQQVSIMASDSLYPLAFGAYPASVVGPSRHSLFIFNLEISQPSFEKMTGVLKNTGWFIFLYSVCSHWLPPHLSLSSYLESS